MGTSLAAAYDAIAPAYDAQLEANPLAAHMRACLWAHFSRAFRPGDRVLDFTCGTGSDAVFLARRGVRVTALDASPGMLAVLRAKAEAQGLEGMIATEIGQVERVEIGDWGLFDGAISTFAGLNTMDDRPRLARALAARLQPGARVILHALNRFCLWDSLTGAERKTEIAIGGQTVTHTLLDPRQLYRAAFAGHFELAGIYGLCVAAPPARAADFARRHPRLTAALISVDRLAGRLLPAAGDFFVVELIA